MQMAYHALHTVRLEFLASIFRERLEFFIHALQTILVPISPNALYAAAQTLAQNCSGLALATQVPPPPAPATAGPFLELGHARP